MNRKLHALIIGGAGYVSTLLTPVALHAAPPGPPGGEKPPAQTFADVNEVFGFLKTVANWIFAVLLVFGVIWLLVGAFKYLTAGGDAEAQGTARSQIIHGLIAIAIGVLALTAVNVVARYFGGPTITL
ncbi:MAG: hypothetical protein U1A16_00190 [Patescibacteria group bacterium]|nr:hypothetical protein [Patescibacteria group bacterium]